MKCSTCKMEKSESDFYNRSDRKSGLSSQCKECVRQRARKWYADNKQRAASNMRSWRENNAVARAHYNRLRYYGLTPEEYTSMRAEQGDSCAICLRGDRELVVDHCHDSGRVRGLLCGKCNSALGYLGDDPTVVQRAAEYLNTHKTLAAAR